MIIFCKIGVSDSRAAEHYSLLRCDAVVGREGSDVSEYQSNFRLVLDCLTSKMDAQQSFETNVERPGVTYRGI